MLHTKAAQPGPNQAGRAHWPRPASEGHGAKRMLLKHSSDHMHDYHEIVEREITLGDAAPEETGSILLSRAARIPIAEKENCATISNPQTRHEEMLPYGIR